MAQLIPEDANIYELNHLAHRLDALTEHERNCFEGVVWMDANKNGNTPIPLERLINFTHSIEDCRIAYDAKNDGQLGKFYVDNDMADILENLPEAVYALLNYEAIARKARLAEGGVFTERGYVVLSGEVSHAYREGSAVLQEKPTHTILLELRKVKYQKKSRPQGHKTLRPYSFKKGGPYDKV